jgi:2-phospho-L-lactate guanylyltransferase
VRGLGDGKARLGSALDAEERETLVLGMLHETLSVLAGWPAVRQVHVVTRDPVIREFAAMHGATPTVDDDRGDLNAALVAGRGAALAAGASALLCLPADLPLLRQESLERMLDAADAALAAGRGRPVVVIAPSDARGGTNGLLLSPPTVIEPAFGGLSLEAHVRAAAAADATVQLVVDAFLGFDLDTPEDLERLDAGRIVELIASGSDALSMSDAH